MSSPFEAPPHHEAMDIGSIVIIVLSALGYMPQMAASLAFVWYLIVIYDRIRNGPKKN